MPSPATESIGLLGLLVLGGPVRARSRQRRHEFSSTWRPKMICDMIVVAGVLLISPPPFHIPITASKHIPLGRSFLDSTQFLA